MIEVKKLSEKELASLGVKDWPVWQKGKSKFSWYYDEKESCYIIEGEAIVRTQDGREVRFGAGDFVVFPKGLKCEWEIVKDIKKNYRIGE